ncbi:UTP--glucose-1-phosphate uridylyltransferase [Natronococcus pandeyae]|uniref:UTP--glucose-1-phosphate uridylyltransferase n=1 Tax=Natronococcus pandeyae TaxID=2055836 RepID=A0A8J8TSQ1_9EURY|nr:sugar phosphate nucleotidyltransferase [Natronococcus pandeyae]TYL39310.1 UTP--glucose-1-phosphate uridylyltransferase [Natronococcus pandeyae]
MQGVVPAAGEGTRLRPLTDEQPKGLVTVDEQPLLTHVFETLLEAGVDELVVVVGYRKAQIVDHYGDAYRGVPITYVHQREQLGLGHAISLVEPHVDGPFVVLNGDNVFGGSIAPAVERFETTEADLVLLCEEVDRETARATGVVDVDDGAVTEIVEKPAEPPSRLVTTGCYVLPTEIFHALELAAPSERGEYELSEAVGLLAAAGMDVQPVRIPGPRVNVNTTDDIERASRLLEE